MSAAARGGEVLGRVVRHRCGRGPVDVSVEQRPDPRSPSPAPWLLRTGDLTLFAVRFCPFCGAVLRGPEKEERCTTS